MKKFISFLVFILPLVFLYQFVFGAIYYVDCNADGRTLTLTMDESVKFSTGLNGGVTITPTGGAATVTYTRGEYSTALVYTTSRVILSTETLTTTYTQPGDGIENAVGLDLVTFSTQATTNNSTQTTAVGLATISIWPADVTVGADGGDGRAVELGVKFQTSVGGQITGIKFYKQAANTGTHVGNLWSETGTNLGTVTFSGESATGWQTATFATPVQVLANTTYVASVFMSAGYWTSTTDYFLSSVVSGVLTAEASVTGDLNGLYRYTDTSAFPNIGSSGHRNYWVDVNFNFVGSVRGLRITGGTFR